GCLVVRYADQERPRCEIEISPCFVVTYGAAYMPDAENDTRYKYTEDGAELERRFEASRELFAERATDSRPFQWNSKQKTRKAALTEGQRDTADGKYGGCNRQAAENAMVRVLSQVAAEFSGSSARRDKPVKKCPCFGIRDEMQREQHER